MNKTLKQDLLQIVFGIIVGLVGFLVISEVVTHQLEKMGEEVMRRSHEAREESIRRQQELAAQQRRHREAERVGSERLARAKAASKQNELELERAFVASYEAPEGCDHWESDAHMVECVNHRMRAKAAFKQAEAAKFVHE